MRSTAAKLDIQECSLFNSNRAIFVQFFIASESKDLYYLGLLGRSHQITNRLIDQPNSALQRDAGRVVVVLEVVQVTVRRRNKIVEMFNDDEFAYEESRQKGAKDGTWLTVLSRSLEFRFFVVIFAALTIITFPFLCDSGR